MAFGRRSNAQPALTILMQDAAALVGEMLHADLSGVAIVERGGTLTLCVTPVAAPSQGPAAPILCEGSLDPATSVSAYALSTAAPVTVANLAEEKRFCDLFLRKLAVTSVLCVPLYLAKKGLGALGVCSRARREFTVEDAHFVETISHLLASSVGRLQVEEELRLQNAMASAVLETTDQFVLILDTDGKVQEVNPACQRVTGQPSLHARGKPFWDIFAAPEEAESVRRLLRVALSNGETREFQSAVLTRNGERRPIAWSLRTAQGTAENVGQLLLIGVERTEQSPQQPGAAAPATAASAEHPLPPQEPDQAPPACPTVAEIADSVDELTRDGQPAFAAVGGKVGKELRRSPRRTFQYRQWIAPVVAHRLPTRDQFFEVQCNDISAGGISFDFDHKPDFEELVVALGQASQRTYFVARVVRLQSRQGPSGVSYLVGCQFTGRVAL